MVTKYLFIKELSLNKARIVAQQHMCFNIWSDNLVHSSNSSLGLYGVSSISPKKAFITIKVSLWKIVSETKLGKKLASFIWEEVV